MNKSNLNRKKGTFVEKFGDNYFEDLLQAVILEESLKIHRSIKLGYAHLVLPDLNLPDFNNLPISDQNASLTPPLLSSGMNGSSPTVGLHKSASVSSIASAPTKSSSYNNNNHNDSSLKSLTKCVQCSRKVCPSRYASHLSNCMGRGRYSSRRALQRIEEQKKQDIDDRDISEDGDDDGDEDLDDANDEDYQISSHGSSGVSGSGTASNRKLNNRNGSRVVSSTKSSRSVNQPDEGSSTSYTMPAIDPINSDRNSNNTNLQVPKSELNTMWTI